MPDKPFDHFENMREAFSLAKELRPLPHRVMASKYVPWPEAYRQWDTKGRLLLWVNADAVYELPRRNPDDDPFIIFDTFVSIERLMAIPVEFTDA